MLHAASTPGQISSLLHTSQELRKGWQTALFGSQPEPTSVTLSPAALVQCWPQLSCMWNVTEMSLLVPIIFVESTRSWTGTNSSISLSSLFPVTNFLLITSTDQNLLVYFYHLLLPPQLLKFAAVHNLFIVLLMYPFLGAERNKKFKANKMICYCAVQVLALIPLCWYHYLCESAVSWCRGLNWQKSNPPGSLCNPTDFQQQIP